MVMPREQELIGLINKWQDHHDLRPSEVSASLLRMVAYYAPTAQRAELEQQLQKALDLLEPK